MDIRVKEIKKIFMNNSWTFMNIICERKKYDDVILT